MRGFLRLISECIDLTGAVLFDAGAVAVGRMRCSLRFQLSSH